MINSSEVKVVMVLVKEINILSENNRTRNEI